MYRCHLIIWATVSWTNFLILKGLSHEIETGCRWYGCVDLYVERPLGVYYYFSCSVDLLIQIKLLPAVLQQLVNSQISSGNNMQTLLKHFKRLSTPLLQMLKGNG
jgi:hypothetical protein